MPLRFYLFDLKNIAMSLNLCKNIEKVFFVYFLHINFMCVRVLMFSSMYVVTRLDGSRLYFGLQVKLYS